MHIITIKKTNNILKSIFTKFLITIFFGFSHYVCTGQVKLNKTNIIENTSKECKIIEGDLMPFSLFGYGTVANSDNSNMTTGVELIQSKRTITIPAGTNGRIYYSANLRIDGNGCDQTLFPNCDSKISIVVYLDGVAKLSVLHKSTKGLNNTDNINFIPFNNIPFEVTSGTHTVELKCFLHNGTLPVNLNVYSSSIFAIVK